MDVFGLGEVKRMNKRQIAYQILSTGMLVTTALMIWKGLMVLTNSPSPVVVVLTGSMEPAYFRGDLLLLTNFSDPIQVGEPVVFTLDNRQIPVVHRAIRLHEDHNGRRKILTKGDNNAVDDRGLYPTGQHWIYPKDVIGRPQSYLPYVGYVTIIMNDYPEIKWPLLAGLGLMVFLAREQ